MQFVMELWLPILVSGLAVFVLSALVWTVFPHHTKEFAPLANEDAVMDVIRAGNPSPGRYTIPHIADHKASGTPECKARLERGPVAFITIAPNGMPSMGPMMAKSLVFNLVVASLVAYVGWHTLAAGTGYLQVFRVTGATAFMAYALGTVPESIWFSRPWSAWMLGAFDSMLYALVLAGVFGSMWP